MENKIINLLSIKKNMCMSLDEIKKELSVNIEEIKSILSKLEYSGIIYKNKSGKYSLVSRTSLKKGVVQMGKKRRPVVVIDNVGTFDLIYNKNNIVENNSVVLVEPNFNCNSATVVKVLNNQSNTFVGQVIRKGNNLVIRSKDHNDIILNKEYPEGVNVLVDANTSKIKEIIDSNYEVMVKTMLVKGGVPITYSDEYLRELNGISDSLRREDIKKALSEGALDLRNKNFVTINSNFAICFEDNELIISIADLSSAVKESARFFELYHLVFS